MGKSVDHCLSRFQQIFRFGILWISHERYILVSENNGKLPAIKPITVTYHCYCKSLRAKFLSPTTFAMLSWLWSDVCQKEDTGVSENKLNHNPNLMQMHRSKSIVNPVEMFSMHYPLFCPVSSFPQPLLISPPPNPLFYFRVEGADTSRWMAQHHLSL